MSHMRTILVMVGTIFFLGLMGCSGDPAGPVVLGGDEDTGIAEDNTSTEPDVADLDTAVAPTDEGSSAEPGSFILTIEHYFNEAPMELLVDYTTDTGLIVHFTTLRYWISNLVLTDVDGQSFVVPESYYLLEQTSNGVRDTVTITGVPSGDYTTVTFSIGVDEDHNHSLDTLEGELDAGVDMSWSWSSGFIFFKAEGNYLNDAGQTMDFFKAHLGFDDLYKTVSIPLDGSIRVDGTHVGSLVLSAQTSKLFDGLDMMVDNSIVGGPVDSPAGTMAENYSNWFTVLSSGSEKQ